MDKHDDSYQQVLAAPTRQSAKDALEQMIIFREIEMQQLKAMRDGIPWDALSSGAEAALWRVLIDWNTGR